jgi:tryptophan-rich hypothetical protein
MPSIQEAKRIKKLTNTPMNQINPAKLLLSKWTAVLPKDKEKHFLVTGINKDEAGDIVSCNLEAVLTQREYTLDWKELKDNTCWLVGWHSYREPMPDS